jgi:DnaJ like chaperone protein
MSWWGKLLGGGFGFAIGGPLGALIGAALGQTFDSGMKSLAEDALPPGNQERVQMAFFTATFATMGHLAKVDGRVTSDEIAKARNIMSQMQLTDEQRKVAIDLFTEGKAADYDLHGVIDQFRIECRRRTNLMRLFMEIQLQAAYADGVLHPKESELLKSICAQLRFPDFVFRQMEALVRASARADRQQDNSRVAASATMTRAQALELLGLKEGAEQQEVKRAYRKLMSQHHPDKLVAKGLPPEMIKMATERTQRIREAYDLVNAGFS